MRSPKGLGDSIPASLLSCQGETLVRLGHAPHMHDRVASPGPPRLRQRLGLFRRHAPKFVAHRDVFLRKGVGPAQRAHRDVVRRPLADAWQLGQPLDRIIGIVMRTSVEAQPR